MLVYDVLKEVLTDCLVTMNALAMSKTGPAEQGIFRVPGEGELIKKLKDDVNRGAFFIFSSEILELLFALSLHWQILVCTCMLTPRSDSAQPFSL